jgi:ABC-type transporter Mla MlaB component
LEILALPLAPSLLLLMVSTDNCVLKITAASSNGTTTLTLEGRVAGDWVDELSRAVGEARREPGPLTLDLAQVTFVDGTGALLLRALSDSGVALTGSSDFVFGLIRGGQA